MAQHDYNIANQTGANFRADLNNALSAIATTNSGATEPSTTFAHQLWVDTSSSVLKIRNAADNAWVTTGVSITASNTFTGNLTGDVTGNLTGNVTGNVTGDLTGNADSADTLSTARTISLSGDVVGSVSFDGSANVDIDTVVQINSITLGTDTTGDYVESMSGGTGVTVTGGTGEGSTPSIAIGQAVATTDDVTFNLITATDEFVGDIDGAVRFTAKADVALSKGDVVYVSGVSGNTTTVGKAKADDASKMPAFGMAIEDANANNNLQIVTFGNLTSIDTSNESVGEILYVSTTAGEYTTTAPSGESAQIQNIGKVLRSHAVNGSIKVGGAGRSNATPNLDNGKIFIGNGSNQAVTSTLDTSIVVENTNLYYTQARFDSAFTAKSTSDLSEGTNLYYTTTRFDSAFGNKTTADLTENTNLYYTDTRANSAIDARVTKSFVDALGIQATSVSANSVALGTDTTGNYVQTITGTANKITVSGSGSESADITLTLPDDVQIADSLTVAGNLTVNGTLTSLDTTNLDIEDNLFQLNAGLTGSPVNDSGMLINRGNQDNGIFMWDESADKFTMGLTTADGTSTGNITLNSLGTLVVNVEGNVTGNVTGQVSDISNFTTANLTENTNLYYTDARARAAISATGDISYNSTTGVISFSAGTPVTSVNTQTGVVVLDTDDISEGSTNQYFTTGRARTSISASGDIAYNSTTGVISFTAGTSPVTSVNTQTGAVVLDSDDIAEGSTNIYYTNNRADARVNLQTGANLDLSSKSTSDLSEGTNLYHTTERVQFVTNGSHTGISFVYDDAGDGAIDATVSLSSFSTSDLSEGTNLYYTDARFDTRLGTKSTSDLSEGSNLYYTDARVQAVSINNVVEDTTPQLGGDLASNGNMIRFGDSSSATDDRLKFGVSNDLQIYHDGSNSYIDEVGTGNLHIRGSNQLLLQNNDGTKNFVVGNNSDGWVKLYYDNTEKLATSSTGVDITGTLIVDTTINVNDASGYGNIELGGASGGYVDFKTPFNDDFDARIFYGGTNFQITTNADQPILLRHNNSTRLATTSSGIDVTGTVELDNLTVAGSQGTDGQVLTSTGSGIAWEDATGTGTTINNNANNRVITGSDTADTLEAESGLTYDGSNLGVTGTVNSMTIAASGFTCPTSQNFVINSPNALRINIDSNNDGTAEAFTIGHNQDTAANTNVLFNITESGTTTLNSKLDLNFEKQLVAGIPTNNISVTDTTSLAAGVGGAINFSGVYQTGGSTTAFASIEASKETATHNEYGGALVFKTRQDQGSQNEHMRITSTGAVIVGGTSPLGSATFTVDSDSAAIAVFDGSSASGGYLQFRNNNTAKGVLGFGSNAGASSVNNMILGTNTGSLQINVPETAGAAIKLEFGNNDNTTRRTVQAYKDNFEPAAADTGVVGLGSPTSKWKDLYLSGGAYLGGTAAGNKLEDYEEGTWTPSITFGQSSTGITHNVQNGKYVKIGSAVYVSCHCSLSSKGTAAGIADINGLPFTINQQAFGAFQPIGDRQGLSTAGVPVNLYLAAGNAYARLYKNGFTGTGNSTVTNANFTNTTDIDVNFVYYTDS